MKRIILLSLLSIIHLFTYAQPGTNDPTFNTIDDGTFGDGSGFNGDVRSTAIQTDGKILIGGNFTSYNGTVINRIVRLNTNGSIDNSFIPGTGFNNLVESISIQADGKIIVGGYFNSFNGNAINYIVRLNSDGSLDISFNPGTGFNDYVRSTSIQADGKIIVGGFFTSFNGTARNRITRLNIDGSLDVSFNPGTGFDMNVFTLSIQSDGKIIVGGFFNNFNGTVRNYIARLNTNGSLDASFNPGSGFSTYVTSTSIQTDGKIIIGGDFISFNGTARNRIARLNANGTLDGTFNPGTGFNNFVMSTAIQVDGKIIVGGGFTSFNGITQNRIARLNTNGSIDASFNSGTGFNSAIISTYIQADGKIIVGGAFNYINGTIRIRITRLNSDGSLDISFNPGTGFDHYVKTTSIQADGKIIVGGQFYAFNGTASSFFTRLNVNGSLDASFNQGTGFDHYVFTTSIQADGKIIAGGAFTLFNGTARNCINRLNTDGSIDFSFDPGTGFSSYVNSTSIQADGKIIVGGFFTSFNGTSRNYIARLNEDGSLDASFNPGTGFNNPVNFTSIQSDGKIIVGGNFTSFNGTAINRIVRLNSDGSLDASFSSGIGFNDNVFSTSIQSDGKIIVGGDFTSYNGTALNRIARLNTDGSIDASFITGTAFNLSVISTSIQGDGKIIVGGDFTLCNGTAINRIARLNTNGSIDVSFNPGTGLNGRVESISIQSDGKMIVGGVFSTLDGTTRTRIARLLNCSSNIGTDVISSCSTITWIDGATYSTSNNSATHVLTNVAGCDSIVTLNFTRNIANTGLDVISSCNSITWIDGNTYSSSNNTATHVLTNVAGCDSIVTLNFTRNFANTGLDLISSCNSITWIDGNTYTTSNYTATQVLTNAVGCDSIVTLNFTRKLATFGTDVISSCDVVTWIDGNTYPASNNTATHVLTNAVGCDSTVTLNFTRNVVNISTNTTDLTITANAIGASYQWMDCDNGNEPISGETNQSFTATTNGNYAVEVTQNGCTEVSNCVNITTVGISYITNEHIFTIYPNPTNGQVYLNVPLELMEQALTITNAIGQVVNRVEIDKTSIIIDLSNYENGIYFIEITSKKGSIIKKVVKQ